MAGLVRVGGFSRSELLDVLHVLMPYKREPEINEIVDKINDPRLEKQAQQTPTHSVNENIRLLECF